jgi:hypothetical protein
MVAGTTLLACGSDSSSPSPNVNFPSLPSTLLTAFCVRGERAPSQAISGTLAVSDCPLGDGSYFETWRVRVSTSGSYRVAASSSFDNVLFVLRLNGYTADSADVTQIGYNDDTNGTNAVVAAVSLAPDTDYFIIVNGYSASDVGPYTVSFTKN